MLSGDQLSTFKREDWHQRVRFFPDAIDVRGMSLNQDELFQLVADNLVESRLIDADLNVSFGPFELNHLEEENMLMVQCLEAHLDEVQQLTQRHFDFLPAWQIDDVMASCGSVGASCGAHFDHYDVFLLQLTGTKTWQLDNGPHNDSELQDDAQLRLLNSFTPVQEVTARPGDVLYVPPGAGHHGICQDPGITLSIGIRNPTMPELLAEISEYALLETEAHTLDGEISHSGALDASALAPLLQDALSQTIIDLWYGSYVTRLRNPELLVEFESAAEATPGNYSATRPTRLAWHAADSETLLFVNGEHYAMPAASKDWVAGFCQTRTYSADSADQLTLTEALLGAGAIQPV